MRSSEDPLIIAIKESSMLIKLNLGTREQFKFIQHARVHISLKFLIIALINETGEMRLHLFHKDII